jgi:hypothetical protein
VSLFAASAELRIGLSTSGRKLRRSALWFDEMRVRRRRRQRLRDLFVGEGQRKEIQMREHSGAEGKNNNRNPTLREKETEKGKSGEAIHGSKSKDETPSRKSTVRS